MCSGLKAFVLVNALYKAPGLYFDSAKFGWHKVKLCQLALSKICNRLIFSLTTASKLLSDTIPQIRHWKLYEKKLKKKPCLVYGFPTDADSGYCAKYYSKYSAKYHAHNYQMRQKYIAETGTLQLAKTSELSDETPQPTETFELSDVTLQPRIYEAPVSESDDEDMGS
ncbi:hypothetical protein GLOIN_2v1479490 [Rhizophagus clarus]|uniref:Uncharacterized protein n=1 Tax=Rhizophagus clarus TaxID=94130 RepID=A0A8H3KYV5_9GLOM|nr:hypothetical protein GLOIN_2v1479490 [Rhizophagus clarus]